MNDSGIIKRLKKHDKNDIFVSVKFLIMGIKFEVFSYKCYNKCAKMSEFSTVVGFFSPNWKLF